jgi:hypothetical protein
MKHLVLILIILAVCLGQTPLAMAATPSSSTLVISELQTGGLDALGQEDGRQEFIELYNPAASDIDVDGWQVDYFGASSDIGGSPTRLLATLQGKVVAGGRVLLASPDFTNTTTVDLHFDAVSTTSSVSGWLALGGGYVVVNNAAGVTQDVVAWGTAPQVDAWWRAPQIPAGSSIQRVITDGVAGATYDAPSSPPSPLGGGLRAPESPEKPACTGAVLSEILPNAAGTDDGHEFIELFNPTNAPITLAGCSLRLGAEGESFPLPDEVLPAGVYRAFYDTETDITLPNATGDTVWLLSAGTEEATPYPGALVDNESWALISGTWQATRQPTPAAPNELLVVDAGGQDSGSEPDELAPCEAGKERNPETNRCRNPVTIANSELQPCKAGQERNPSTNRCRSVAAAASTLTPCAAGQERNPATNRCRKASGNASSFTKGNDGSSTTPTAMSKARWWLAGIIVAGAGGYGAYEWRTEIIRAANSLRAKLGRTAAE